MGPSDAGEVNFLLDPSSTDDDSFEYRILMAYAKRTWPKDKAAEADTGKAGKADTGKAGKADTGKAGKADTGKAAKADTGKAAEADTGKAAEADTGKAAEADTGKAGKADTGKAGKADTGKAAEADTGKAAEADTGKAGKADTGKAGKADTGKAGKADTGKAGKADTGKAGKADTGKAGKADTGKAGKADTGKAGKADTGKAAEADTGKAAEADTGKAAEADTGKAGKADTGKAGKADTGKAGKADTGKAGKADTGKAGKADTGKAGKATPQGTGVGAEYHAGPNQQVKVKLRQTDKTQSDGKAKSHARKSKGKRKSIWSRIPCFRGESEKSNSPFGEMNEQDNICKSSNKITVPETECESEPSVDEVVDMLQKILKPKNFRVIRSCSLEVDVGDQQKTIDHIISLLSSEGDTIEKEIKQDPNFSRLLGEKPTLSIFKQVMDSVLEVALPTKVNSELESETERKLKMIAFVVHATTRFAADGNHPMAQIMGFGTKYLQENCTSWVSQKGGWAKLMEEEHID